VCLHGIVAWVVEADVLHAISSIYGLRPHSEVRFCNAAEEPGH
jgi:hypothetical protein